MNDKTQHIIIRGHFSKNGNFIGIDNDGKEIHIYKVQMELLNLKSIEDITFPFFAIATIKVFPKLTGEFGDVDRKNIVSKNGENETFERLTALAIFTEFEKFLSIYADQIALEIAVNQNLDSEIIEEETRDAEKLFKKYFDYLISKKRYEA